MCIQCQDGAQWSNVNVLERFHGFLNEKMNICRVIYYFWIKLKVLCHQKCLRSGECLCQTTDFLKCSVFVTVMKLLCSTYICMSCCLHQLSEQIQTESKCIRISFIMSKILLFWRYFAAVTIWRPFNVTIQRFYIAMVSDAHYGQEVDTSLL